MTKTLVTGSSGFIGTQIVKKFSKSEVVTDMYDSVRINLQNRKDVLKIEPTEMVIHLGGKTPKDKIKWIDYFDNNVFGTLNVLEYCVRNKVKKLIFVSSYVYGIPKYSPIDEDHPINPHNAYTESKYLAERLCKFYCERSGINLTVLRPFNIFGESMNEGFIISNLINSIKNGNRITITNKNSKRDFLHVDDFVDLIFKIKDYEFKFEVFNVGSGKSFSFEYIIKKMEEIISKKINIEYEENEEILIEDICADIAKIKNKINWQPKITFDDGLKKVLKF